MGLYFAMYPDRSVMKRKWVDGHAFATLRTHRLQLDRHLASEDQDISEGNIL
jgi:hypothetical protein